MNHAVGGGDIGGGDGGVTDHDGAVHDGESRVVTVHHGRHHAVGDVGCGNGAGVDVVSENVREGGVGLVVVKGREVNASCGESLVSWGEDRERSFALKRSNQPGMGECSDERVVDAGVGGHGSDVFEHGLVGGRHEHLVDDVDDAVVGGDVGRRHVSIVDHDTAVVHGEGDIVAVQHRGLQTVGNVSSVNGAAQDVIGEDVNERGVGLVVVKGGEVDAGSFERSIGRCKDREGPVALKGLHQPSVTQRSNKRLVHAGSGGIGRDVFGFVSRYAEGNGGETQAGNHEERQGTVHGSNGIRAVLKRRYFSIAWMNILRTRGRRDGPGWPPGQRAVQTLQVHLDPVPRHRPRRALLPQSPRLMLAVCPCP